MMPREDDRLSALLAECADMLVSGASLAACLERFPEQAAELEPLLATVASMRELRSVPPRKANLAADSRAAYMNQVFSLQERRSALVAQPSWWQRLFAAPALGAPQRHPVGLFAILLIIIISGIVISGSVTLAAEALPGDLLYGVKTASENVRVFLTLDGETRDGLRAAYSQRRIDEAQAVVDRRQVIDNLRLQGTIESFDATEWVVSGLRVALDASSIIVGQPFVGASVEGIMRAPGDGQLLLVHAEVQPLPGDASTLGQPAAPDTPTTAPTSTWTHTITPSPTLTWTPEALVLPPLTRSAPIDTPTATATPMPSPTGTATRTRTPTPTRTPTVTSTPTATWTLPAPREEPPKYRVSGRLTAINGSVWTANGTGFEVNASTSITGSPAIGAMVECTIVERPNALPLALSCVVTAPPEAPPEPFEFQDYVKAIDGEWWAIGDFRVKVTSDTRLPDNPVVGDLVNVKALRQATGELWATSITPIRATQVLIDGIIEAYGGGTITVGGHSIAITGDTQFVGTPQVGLPAQVQALQMPDGSLIAQIVVVIEPTEIPTTAPIESPTAAPTETATVAPTETATVAPTEMATVAPTETATVAPPETATDEPTATPSP